MTGEHESVPQSSCVGADAFVRPATLSEAKGSVRRRQFWRNAGIGTGMLKAVIAPPIPFSHVLGGNVQPVPLPWHPAAQNM